MNVKQLLICLLLCLTLPCAALAAGTNIRFESKAEIEIKEINEKGEKVLVRQPAKLVVPGTIVIYTNSYTNISTKSAENLVITNPVPEKMEFLSGSVLPDTAVITYSIDGGKTYATPDQLIITEADGRKRTAEAREYTHIRWQIQDPLPTGGTGQVEFRARLK
jgi:uncharacterized repeat protein (TIGR01451 family)